MARRALLDTGFVVALLNQADPDHDRCVEVWRELRTQLLSVDGFSSRRADSRPTASGVSGFA